MIVDTSAVIAILYDESDAAAHAWTLAGSETPQISAANYLEAAVVIDSAADPVASRRFDDLVAAARLVIEPVTADQARLARAAYRDFGRGSGHPARLNFGDCFAYALAKSAGDALLFKGDDFTHTDIAVAPLRDDPPTRDI